MLRGLPLFGKGHNIGKLITIVRGVDYLPLCYELFTSWTDGILDDVYIISLMFTASVLGIIFVVLLLIT